MTATKAPKRLSKVAKEFNVGTTTIREYLTEKGIEISNSPNAKIPPEAYEALLEKFQPDKLDKEKTEEIVLPGSEKKQKEAEAEPAPDKKTEQPAEEAETTSQAETTEKAPETSQESPEENKEEATPAKEESEPQEEVEEKVSEKEEKPTSESTTEDQTETTEEEKPDSEKEEVGPKVLGKVDLEEIEKKSPKKGKGGKKSPKKSEEKPEEESKEEAAADKAEPVDEEPVAQKEGEPSTEKAEEEGTEQAEKEEEAEATDKEEMTEEERVAEEQPEEAKDESSETSEGEEEGGEDKEEVSKKEDYQLKGPTVVGKIDLEQVKSNKPKSGSKEPVASTSDMSSIKKKRRKRKRVKSEEQEKQEKSETTGSGGSNNARPIEKKNHDKEKPTKERRKEQRKKKKSKKEVKDEIDEKQVQEQIKDTLTKLSGKQSGGSRSKFRKKKRDETKQREEELQEQLEEQEKNKIQVTEFITINELASIMDVSVTDLITTCMNLGLMVSINQRVDAEAITLLADEYGYEVEFTEAEMDEPSMEEEDNPENYVEKPPVITIMGHVDHGKTSLLDYIQGSKIIAGESGGITQHIGAYEVTMDNGRNITFLDTPGHEAFTAMRARGAKATDIAIIIIAADDNVMPQTKEAISHAQAAGVPMIFAINKVDKEGANPERIKQELAEMNILVEDWGGKYQCEEISAKQGQNVDELLEKVLLESDILELKTDPQKRAVGTVVEAWLDKGKGIVTNLLVESGTLRVSDPVLAGSHYGRVRAMLDERGRKVKEAEPGQPVQVLGFDGAPQAGERFYATEDEHTAKEVATERKQLIREQGIRATRHITLDEIGRRLAIGNFQELNVVIKGDVDGSVEAIADSLEKLSTEEVHIKVIHKGVGMITENDVLLASASDAIIVGFQVRPSSNARRLAEQEQIDIRLYSVIYDAIQEVRSAMEGMLAPKVEENAVGNVEVRDIFNVSKVGKVAGCKVMDGKVTKDSKVRVVRDGVVMHTGEIGTLKRYKDDVKEVTAGYECGLNIKNFDDIQQGDNLEVYEEIEVKRTL